MSRGEKYCIREYGAFSCEKEADGCIPLNEHTFAQLEEFILSNKTKNGEAIELMGISARRGVGKIITAKNYVGIITMKDGTIIEILPKIYSAVEDDDELKAKKLLLNMLKTLRDTPYKSIQTSDVTIEKMNIFEIFIKMFVEEVRDIVKKGLSSAYETKEENINFFRGKLMLSHQIKCNYAHRERMFVAHDDFTVNRPENKLLKSTLLYLHSITRSWRSKADIKSLIDEFDCVDVSQNYDADFAKIVSERSTRAYSMALMWAKVFLKGKSFTSFAGSQVSMALLFPMETLFESYVAKLVKKILLTQQYAVSVQDKGHFLFDFPRKFMIKPDIVVSEKSTKTLFLLDTKWKLLNNAKSTFGISQLDMYQMYVYQKKYGSKSVTLIYPRTGLVEEESISFMSKDNVLVNVMFVDLFDAKNSIKKLLDCILK